MSRFTGYRFLLFAAAFSSIFLTHSPSIAQSPPPDSAPDVYALKILLSDPPRAEVRADLNVRDARLLMIGGSVDHLPRGWATFVRHIQITDEKGSPLALEEFSDDKYKTQWRVGDAFRARARLSYEIDLSFAKTKWGAGNEQAAFYDGKALFAASRVFFIVADVNARAEVRLDIPAAAKLAVP